MVLEPVAVIITGAFDPLPAEPLIVRPNVVPRRIKLFQLAPPPDVVLCGHILILLHVQHFFQPRLVRLAFCDVDSPPDA